MYYPSRVRFTHCENVNVNEELDYHFDCPAQFTICAGFVYLLLVIVAAAAAAITSSVVVAVVIDAQMVKRLTEVHVYRSW